MEEANAAMEAERALRAFGWALAASGAWFLAKHWREARSWASGRAAPRRGPALQLFAMLFQALALADGLALALGAGWAMGAPGLMLLVSVALGLSGGKLAKGEPKKGSGPAS